MLLCFSKSLMLLLMVFQISSNTPLALGAAMRNTGNGLERKRRTLALLAWDWDLKLLLQIKRHLLQMVVPRGLLPVRIGSKQKLLAIIVSNHLSHRHADSTRHQLLSAAQPLTHENRASCPPRTTSGAFKANGPPSFPDSTAMTGWPLRGACGSTSWVWG